MMNLNSLCNQAHETAVNKGFWDAGDANDFPFVAYKLAMIHSEVTEVMEAIRKSRGRVEVEDEFADIIIRVCDLYQACLDNNIVFRVLDEAVESKMVINKDRKKMHGVKG
jgi:NTP pyrophosphatase (non-canonical NTP hydrolase)